MARSVRAGEGKKRGATPSGTAGGRARGLPLPQGVTPLSHERFRVLVVDDDLSVLDGYRRLLERAGYRAASESDPCRVLDGAHDLESVDVLVLDYKMPGMDGLSLLAELRRREIRARCILVSAFVNDGVRQQASLLGVDRILEKPVDVVSFRSAVADLLPRNGGRASLLAV